SWCAGFNCGHLLEMAGQRIIHAAPLSATDLWDIDQHISLSRYHHHFFSAEAIHHRDDSWCAGFNCGHLLEMAGQRIIHAAPLSATDLWD
ncbi:hypothetical protein QWO81_24150, partial [Salmonella enterica subsp. enterica serovar Typhimurium]|nr:hypothetical protein [Salmonella enterica subsp. enterica serovar Typhimurium]